MTITRRSSALPLVILALVAGMGCQRAEPIKVNQPPAPVPAVVATPAVTPPVVAAAPAPSLPTSEPVVSKTSAATPASTVGASRGAATHRSGTVPILRAVRVGKQPGVDRLVFEFNTAGLPEWDVEYVDRPVRDCGSGDAVPVAGDAYLQIRFTGAQAHTEKGESTSGPRRRPLAQPIARELVRTCDFEGEVTWVVGVARPNPYTPRTMVEPSRLVIDIAH